MAPSDIYFIQLATLLGSSLTSLCPRSAVFLPALSPLSLFHIICPLVAPSLPFPFSCLFSAPVFDAFYFFKPNDIDIPDPVPSCASPRARPLAKSFDWLFLWSLSLVITYLKNRCVKTEIDPRPKASDSPPSRGGTLSRLDKLLRAGHKNKWKAISV